MTSNLIRQSASAIVDKLRTEEITPLDLLDALEERIEEVDKSVNALPTLCFDRSRANARELMKKPVAERGRLAGLPVPIKDLTEVEGVRTTYGSPIYADFVPERSDVMVTHLERDGAIVYAKSATPEFGAGANTFNEVFGATRNPWNTDRSAAGSSGGAAVALATGMAWVAQGSDLGGSLRNPASFCGIVGMRPSPGRVARDPGVLADDILAVEGPMARTVEDVALLLDAMSGEEVTDPISLPREQRSYLEAARTPGRLRKVAFSPDLGITPVDPEVAETCRRAAYRFAEIGVTVEDAHPDFNEAHETFQTLRAAGFAASHAQKLKDHADLLKPEVIWNIEKGLKLTMADLVRAQTKRGEMMKRAHAFFDDYDVLMTPATIVAPYPVETRYVEECGGVKFATYIDWLAIAYAITLTGAPALSLPCGFTSEGLPVGLQIVARPRGEAKLIGAAAQLEKLLDLGTVNPIDPKTGRDGPQADR
ncbi:amidase family protein [Aquamicrobium sp. LC103]|uniref:amidase n=1 Tax=Aquamicrobium sp. LC103 TaxID=1120658 RepID=UPI00063EB055|nr:amidase family protein [Aquamicrobium sp. LC103]TKT81450.1 amidase [Aquamicrobium sp. LC103]